MLNPVLLRNTDVMSKPSLFNLLWSDLYMYYNQNKKKKPTKKATVVTIRSLSIYDLSAIDVNLLHFMKYCIVKDNFKKSTQMWPWIERVQGNIENYENDNDMFCSTDKRNFIKEQMCNWTECENNYS